MKERYYAE